MHNISFKSMSGLKVYLGKRIIAKYHWIGTDCGDRDNVNKRIRHIGNTMNRWNFSFK